MLKVLPYQIHVVEDQEVDFLALRRAFAAAAPERKMNVELTRYKSGEEAFEALANGAKPDLLFVDLRLGRGQCGLKFLARVKRDKRIPPCPKVILSTSTEEADVKRGFKEGASGYFVKSVRFDELARTVGVCLEYWFGLSLERLSALNADGLRCGRRFQSRPSVGDPESQEA